MLVARPSVCSVVSFPASADSLFSTQEDLGEGQPVKEGSMEPALEGGDYGETGQSPLLFIRIYKVLVTLDYLGHCLNLVP